MVGGDDFYRYWRADNSEAEDHVALQEVVQPVPLAELKTGVKQIVAELAPNESPDVQHGLTQWLLQIPSATRQAMKRPADPSGTTVPATLSLRKPMDVLPLLPLGLSQFDIGERPACLHGDWELVDLLGRGGQGEVWKACRIDDPEFVSAFKFCTDADAKRQLQLAHEKAVVQRVKKSNLKGVVTLEDYKLDASPPWLRYELVEGGDLAGFVEEWNEKPKVDRATAALGILQRLAKTVGQFHRLPDPVIHRDLKPANILVRRLVEANKTTYQFLVADFGIGHIAARRQLDQSQVATPRARSLGTLRYMCTPLYASPQQKRGDDPDPRDDVYALGVIGYQLILRDLTRSAPTGLGWDKRLRERRRAEGHTALAEGYIALLGECMAEDPDDRPKDAQELYERLVEIVTSNAPGSSAPATPKAAVEMPVAPVTKRPKVGDVITNSIGMKLAWIPPGKFMMGSPKNEEGRSDDEGPQHEVEISRGFYMGVTPVTQEEYQQVMKANPSYFSQTGDGKTKVNGVDTKRFPVENVTWHEATEFCRRLSEMDGKAYDLPTEAEWECACRGGSPQYQAFSFGNSLTSRQANFNSALGRTSKVETYPANAFGLFEMHGNVYEWCKDCYDEKFYNNAPKVDPECTSGSDRVYRGGAWRTLARYCRSAYRGWNVPARRHYDLGFRLALIASRRE